MHSRLITHLASGSHPEFQQNESFSTTLKVLFLDRLPGYVKSLEKSTMFWKVLAGCGKRCKHAWVSLVCTPGIARRDNETRQAGPARPVNLVHLVVLFVWLVSLNISRRLFRKAVQQGRSKRRGEAYASVR